MDKILEIARDYDVNHTRYYTLNLEAGMKNGNDRFFEGSNTFMLSEQELKNYKKILPLSEAKKWAKDNGYTHLKVIDIKYGKQDKTYCL